MSSGRSAACRASSPTTSRLISSVQWRSSKMSMVGRSIASRMRSAAVRTMSRRDPSASPSCRPSIASRPFDNALNGSLPRIPVAISRIEARGTWWSWGATDPPSTRSPAASALRIAALIRRVLPSPAWPEMKSAWPRPRSASAISSSNSSSRWSRPTRIGHWTMRPVLLIEGSVGAAHQAPHRSNDRWTPAP